MASYLKIMFAPASATESDILTVWTYLAGVIVPSYVRWEAWRSGQVTDEDWQKQRGVVAFDTPVMVEEIARALRSIPSGASPATQSEPLAISPSGRGD